MKKRMIALLLAMLMILGLGTVAVSAEESAQLVLSAQYSGSHAIVEVAIENAADLTDGKLEAVYNAEELVLVSARASDASAVASVNTKTAGTVTMAWVGSKLTDEKTLMLTLEFSVKAKASATVSVSAPEANASGTALTVASASVTVPPYNPFVDIDGHWAEDEILLAYHAGLFKGMTDTEFVPDIEINRAMFVTVLYRLDGAPETDIDELVFEDVPAAAFCAPAVVWATQIGVTNGTSATTFDPWENITRQEMITMLYRYARYKGEDVSAAADMSSFTDAQDAGTWAADAMQWAVAEGLIIGYPDSTIRPFATATRAQAAALLCRFAGLA